MKHSLPSNAVPVHWPTDTVVRREIRLVGVSATHVYCPASPGWRQSRNSCDLVILRVTDAGSESNVSSSIQLTLLPCSRQSITSAHPAGCSTASYCLSVNNSSPTNLKHCTYVSVIPKSRPRLHYLHIHVHSAYDFLFHHLELAFKLSPSL